MTPATDGVLLEAQNIPTELKERHQWVVWKYIQRDGKHQKCCFQPDGTPAKSNDAATWCRFDEAIDTYELGGWAGIGYVFADTDPFCGLDLDGCRNPETGVTEDWAQLIVSKAGSYAEVSPSGTGWKIFGIGRNPFESGKNFKLEDRRKYRKVANKEPGLEIYDTTRWFAVTGHANGMTQLANIDGVLSDLFGEFNRPVRHNTSRIRNDNEVGRRARNYVAKMPPAISGQGGHNATFAVACKLAISFDLPESDAWPILLEYNERCDPPWSERDLRHKLHDAYQQRNERGSLLGNDQDRSGHDGITRMCEAASVHVAEGQTDIANGERLLEIHGEDLRYVGPWQKWIVFNSRGWQLDDMALVEGKCRDVAKSVFGELAITGMADNATMRFAKHTASVAGLSSAAKAARSKVAVHHSELDQHPFLFNVQNGTIDLRTGELLPHCRSHMITQISPVAFDPAADCKLWRTFLNRIMDNNQELIGYLCRLVGYSLTGCVSEHILPILYGTGANGKSVFTNTIMGLMGGDYAMQCPQSMLMASKHERHPTELADLFGKRLAAGVETDQGSRFSESLVKSLTGGDTIRARRCREDFWQFEPTHKIWLATNYKPRVRGTDNGIWRRLKLVPFTITIPAEERDIDLTDKLVAEWPGILNWAILGCQEWQNEGLGEPAAVRDATASYRFESDVIGQFLDDQCEIAELSRTKAKDLYDAFTRWHSENYGTVNAISSTEFGKQLGGRGLEKIKSHGVNMYVGIVLKQSVDA
ncbi:MAG: phage/plasmid primase, P4 family [Pirellulaceae bacterium]